MQINIGIKNKQYVHLQALVNKKQLVEAEISAAFQAVLNGIDNIPTNGHVIGIENKDEPTILLEVPDPKPPQLVKE